MMLRMYCVQTVFYVYVTLSCSQFSNHVSSGTPVGTRPARLASPASCGENFLDRAIERVAPSYLFNSRPIASFLLDPEMSEKSEIISTLLYDTLWRRRNFVHIRLKPPKGL